MRIIGYIRVSDKAQANNLSLPLQKEAIEKWCKDHGHYLLDVYSDVESAESAINRHGLQEALSNIFDNTADGLVVYKYDRFCRSVLDSEHLKARFKQAGKSLHSVIDHVDWNTEDGEMLYQFKAVFAEYERKQIRKRCRAGQEKKIRDGGYGGGHPPFGYDAINGSLVRNELEMRALNCIIEMRQSWFTFVTIAQYLNACGVKTKQGCQWTGQSVSALYRRRPNIKLKLPA